MTLRPSGDVVTDYDQQTVKFIESEIRVCKRRIGLAGWLLIAACISIPVSIFTGNKMLGFCAVSWLASSLVTASAYISTSMEEEWQLKLDLAKGRGASAAKPVSSGITIRHDFGPIGLN